MCVISDRRFFNSSNESLIVHSSNKFQLVRLGHSDKIKILEYQKFMLKLKREIFTEHNGGLAEWAYAIFCVYMTMLSFSAIGWASVLIEKIFALVKRILCKKMINPEKMLLHFSA